MTLTLFQDILISTYTAPSGPNSIDNENDAAKSAEIVFEDLQNKNRDLLDRNDGFVVACYSLHPLTERIKSIMPDDQSISVIGIFDASILIAIELLLWPRDGAKPRLGQFGIVTTGTYWEQVLTDGAREIMERENIPSHFFSRVVSTGLSAAELHTMPAEEVRSRMIEATKKLLDDESVRVICLGCAGMAGMDATVREACIEKRGTIAGEEVNIVDGIQAAISVVKGVYHKGRNESTVDPSSVHLAALQTYLKSL